MNNSRFKLVSLRTIELEVCPPLATIPGQRRMNAANRIRSALKHGDITADDLITTSSPTEDADHV